MVYRNSLLLRELQLFIHWKWSDLVGPTTLKMWARVSSHQRERSTLWPPIFGWKKIKSAKSRSPSSHKSHHETHDLNKKVSQVKRNGINQTLSREPRVFSVFSQKIINIIIYQTLIVFASSHPFIIFVIFFYHVFFPHYWLLLHPKNKSTSKKIR